MVDLHKSYSNSADDEQLERMMRDAVDNADEGEFESIKKHMPSLTEKPQYAVDADIARRNKINSEIIALQNSDSFYKQQHPYHAGTIARYIELHALLTELE